MKAKLVKESLENRIPNDAMNIILDIGNIVKSILSLDSSSIENIQYNSKSHTYEGVLSNSGELTLDDIQFFRDEISKEFPEYEENIQIKYDRNTDGMIISLDA